DHAGAFLVLQHCFAHEPKLLHDGRAVGDLRHGKVQRHVARHPDVFLRVEREGADDEPGLEGFHLGRIIGGKPQEGVRLGVADPDSILGGDNDIEGGLEPLDLDDATVLDASAGGLLRHGICSQVVGILWAASRPRSEPCRFNSPTVVCSATRFSKPSASAPCAAANWASPRPPSPISSASLAKPSPAGGRPTATAALTRCPSNARGGPLAPADSSPTDRLSTSRACSTTSCPRTSTSPCRCGRARRSPS